jgi:OmpA-OmpF porin, OOP family
MLSDSLSVTFSGSNQLRREVMHWKKIGVSVVALLCLVASSVIGAKADENQVKGTIISRAGETLIVKAAEGGKTTVVLTGDTTTKDNRGLLGIRKEYMSNVVLIPGLKVNVYGTADEQGRVVARTINVDGDDLETAQMIESGLHPTAEQVETNVRAIASNKEDIESHDVQLAAQKQSIETNQQSIAANKSRIEENMKDIEANTNRFMSLDDYDVKGQATVKFGFGSSEISAKEQEQLKALAQTASGLDGYFLEVTGFADSTGSASMNTKLSEQRAQAVVTYLFQQCSIPMRRIVAPGAMGEYGAAAPNETKAGRAENRRVEVKILVNKGVTGSGT